MAGKRNTRGKMMADRSAAAKRFEEAFAGLRQILKRHAGRLFVKHDAPYNYYLETVSASWKGNRMFFGAVQIRKNYVSFYLMQVYACPALLKSMSPELKRRMQGKSCFNFTAPDERLFRELRALTDAGSRKFQAAKYL